MGVYRIGIIVKSTHNLNEMVDFVNNNGIRPTC